MYAKLWKDEKCLLRATDWVFKCNSLRFVCKELIKWSWNYVQVDMNNLQVLSPHLPEKTQERGVKSVEMIAESEMSTAL
jgi:hypothetical protein